MVMLDDKHLLYRLRVSEYEQPYILDYRWA
jgi:hypothetical protein